jgi:putative hydrolase of the HAD superfamily
VSNTEAVLTAYDLDQTKIGEFFDVILLSSDLGIKKPDKRVFDSALRSLNASKQNTVFIGDNLTDDIEGARRAGLRSIYVMNQPRSPLTMFGSDKEMVRASQPTLEGILGALDSFESVE